MKITRVRNNVLGSKYTRDLDTTTDIHRDEDVYGQDNFEEYEDDIKEIDQEFTSENTSINSTKLPAIFKMVKFEPGTVNIDYGGGKFDNVADYLSQYDVVNLVYDPYNRSADHNKEVIRLVREHGGADTATCSNVLNVIKEPEVRLNVLNNIKKLVKPNGEVYITVYEGTGKGNEGETKSGYQLNRKTADYLEEIQEVFPDAKRKGKLIIAHPSGSSNSSINSSYGGAFDIEDDQVFSKEELIEIGNEIADYANSKLVDYDSVLELAGAYADGTTIDLDFQDNYYGDEFNIKFKVDLRRTRSYNTSRILDKYLEYAGNMLVDEVVKTVSGYQDYVEECEDVFSSSLLEDSKVENLRKDIEKKIEEVMTSSNFGFPLDEVWEYTFVDIEDVSNRDYGFETPAVRVEVRAEVSFEGLMDLMQELDPIVEKYDSDAYFDAVDPTIVEAFVRV